MDAPVQPSFIPRKPVSSPGFESGGSWLGILLFFIASLCLVASLLAAGGAFLYQRHLASSIASKSEMLRQAEEAFNPATIQELTRLDSRFRNARSLLQNHVTALGIFDFLSEDTLQTVQFTNFTYEVSSGGVAEVTLVGVADGFPTIALQSDRFGANPELKDVVFSAIVVNTDGHVGFTVRFTVDPTMINYAKKLVEQPQDQLQTTPNPTSTPTSTTSPQP